MSPTTAPSAVRFEGLGADVLGIGDAAPRISWRQPPGPVPLRAELRATRGSEVLVAEVDPSGRFVAWPWEPLASRERVIVEVRVGHDGTWSGWSVPSFVEAGLLEPGDWAARFVGAPPGEEGDALPLLRSPEYRVRGEVRRARAYVTAHGVAEFEIDGRPVGDEVLDPGWQSYRHRLRYRAHDVTAHLAGRDAVRVGALVGEGWYRGRLGFPLIVRDRVYGDDLGVLVQLEVDYVDGTRDVLASGADWTWRPGPILASDLYDGEQHDARRELAGWSSTGSAEEGWRAVTDRAIDTRLVAPTGPPVRRIEEIAPVAVERRPGRVRLDFGQNLVGRMRITVDGEAGDELVLHHAEVLENGELALRPLRTAQARDRYLHGGRGAETWEPRFTYHGFRYAEITGPEASLDGLVARAVVLHSDLRRVGSFTVSDPLLERLHRNVEWSLRGNFVDIPTDCPQRDERLGWTGDIAVFAPTASFLYDVDGFLRSWLEDLALEQRPDGTVPFFVPELELPVRHAGEPGLDLVPTAIWGDAAVTVPWALYESSGDVAPLRRQYASMRAWIDRVLALAGPSGVWDEGFQFGDWLDPAAPADDPGAALTETALVATASIAHSTRLLARAAGLLGETDAAAHYAAEAERIGRAFRQRFVDASGLMTSDTQTAYALALRDDLLPVELRPAAGRRLVELVRAAGHRIATGFAGTPLILHALSGVGAHGDAYRLLQQTEAPSWLYAVRMGATTIWERWDSMLPDGSLNPGEMTSFNHYALGAVAHWMHEVIGGLRAVEPGYRRVRIAPRPGGGIRSAAVEHESPWGRIAVSWATRADGVVEVSSTIPEGVVAELDLGDGPEEVGGGVHHRVMLTAAPAAGEGTDTAFTAELPRRGTGG